MRQRLTEVASTRIRALANAAGLSPLAAMRLSALVALDLAALAFAIGAVLGEDAQGEAPKTGWRPPRLLAPAAERAVAGDDADALARPIFWRSRRPLPASASDRKARSAQALGTASGFSVAGIVKFGPQARVFVVSPNSPEGRWVAKGENLDGWTVDDITDFDVTLTDGGQVASLRLYGETSEQTNDQAEQQPQQVDAPDQPEQVDEPAEPAPEVAPDAK